jgi:hypothetical protein
VIAMQVVETTVTSAAIRVRLADDPDPAKRSEWILLRLQRSKLKRGSGEPAANLDVLGFPLIQKIALENAQAALAVEIERLRSLADPIHALR